MKILNSTILSIISIVALSIALLWPRSDYSSHEDFVECLLNNSHPSHPISEAIYTPNNSSYSSVLQSYIRNLRFNTSSTPKPILILTALHVSHIQSAIVCGLKHGLQMKIRSGGHDYEGVSYVSNVPFFILDMFNLRSIDVNIQDETAWVQAGAILGEVFFRIAEKSKIHGFPAGVCPNVGVGGHLSSGGYGNMMRKYGLSVDNIIDAQFIDVNGRIVNRESMGEDLFWAIRGGGGSFGVVLAYKIRLVRVPEIVTVFQVERTLEQNATEMVYQWQQVASKLDKDLFIRLMLDVVTTSQGTKTVRATFVSLYLGDSKRLISIIDNSFPQLGLVQSDCSEMTWLESVLYWANFPIGTPIETMLNRTPQVLVFLKRKSDYVKEPIFKEGLELIWKRMMELEGMAMYFNPYGGKMDEISGSETPFPHRAGNLWKIQYLANWEEEAATSHNINLARELYNYMTPFVSKNPRQAYFNYRDLDLGVNSHGRDGHSKGLVYGSKYFNNNFNRLVEIKTRVDPHNFFRNEQSIPILPP